jgi:hypothetical protein
MPVMVLWTASGAAKDPVIVTPLMEFVRQRRAARFAPQVLFFTIS